MAYKSINTPLDEEFAVIRDFWESKIVREGVFSLTVGGIKCDYTENTASDIKFSEKSGNTVCTRTFSYGQLLIRTEAVLYDDLPLTEWTVYVRNASDRITPRVTFNAFEHRFGCGYPTVYRHIGSDARPDDHMPFADPLGYCEKISVSPYGGRSSNHEWPYFSVALGNGSGFNLAIGWLGQWEANFERRDGLYVSAGQQRLDSVMLPGEEFRSPRILLQSWSYAGMPEKQAVRRSQNIFRRFMRKYNMPRYADGSIPTHGLAACSSHQFLEMTRSTAKDQIDFIDAYEKRGIRLDNCGWMPAGMRDRHPTGAISGHGAVTKSGFRTVCARSRNMPAQRGWEPSSGMNLRGSEAEASCSVNTVIFFFLRYIRTEPTKPIPITGFLISAMTRRGNG